MLSMHESRGSDEAHQLGAEYGLGEYIREYKVKLPTLSGLFVATIFLSLLGVGGVLMASGFRFGLNSLIAFSIVIPLCALISVFASIPTWRARKAAVYIFSNGFIMRDKQQTRMVYWYAVERVESSEDDISCVVHLADQTSLKPNEHLAELKMLATELKLKAQLGAHPEKSLEIERQVEQFRNDPPWLQHARKRANLSKEKEQFLKKNVPEEAYQLGEEHQLGKVLGTYRATFQSLFLPNRSTFVEYVFMLFTAGLIALNLSTQSSNWFILLFLFLPLQLILLRFAARRSRLHFYEAGLIYIQAGSIEVVRWEQVEKTRCTSLYELFKPYCTLYLKDTSKVEISKYLNKHNNMKHTLSTKTLLEETYLSKKKQNKDEYIDIGHLAD